MATPGQPRQISPDIPVIQRNTPQVFVPQGNPGMEALQAALSRLAERRSGERSREEEAKLAKELQALQQAGALEQIGKKHEGDVALEGVRSTNALAEKEKEYDLRKQEFEDVAKLNDPVARLQRSAQNLKPELGLSPEASLLDTLGALAKKKQDLAEQEQRAILGVSPEVKGSLSDIRFKQEMAIKARDAALDASKTVMEGALAKAGKLPASVQLRMLDEETKKKKDSLSAAQYVITSQAAAGRHQYAQNAVNFVNTEGAQLAKLFAPKSTAAPAVPPAINYWWGDDAAKDQAAKLGPPPVGEFSSARWGEDQVAFAERAVESTLSGMPPEYLNAAKGMVRLALANPSEEAGVQEVAQKYGFERMNSQGWAAVYAALGGIQNQILEQPGENAYATDLTRSEGSREKVARAAAASQEKSAPMTPEYRRFLTTVMARTMQRIEPATRQAYAQMSKDQQYVQRLEQITTENPDATPDEYLKMARQARMIQSLGDLAWDHSIRRITNPETPLSPEEEKLDQLLTEVSPKWLELKADGMKAAEYLRSPEYQKEWEAKAQSPEIKAGAEAKVRERMAQAQAGVTEPSDAEIAEQRGSLLGGMPATYPMNAPPDAKGTPASQPTSQPVKAPPPSAQMLRDLAPSYAAKSGAELNPAIQSAITGTYGDFPFTLSGISLDSIEGYPEIQDALAGMTYEPIFTRKITPNLDETLKAFSLQDTVPDTLKNMESSKPSRPAVERPGGPSDPMWQQGRQPAPQPQMPQGQPLPAPGAMQPGVQPGMQGPQMPQGQPGPMGPPAPPQAPQGGGVGMYNPSQLQQFGPLPGAPPQMGGAFA